MSILGYSSSYFLPEYWGNTPFYGEKLIPLLDYVLSTEYEESAKLAEAFYAVQDKYKGVSNLPLWAIQEIIDESGYSYIKDLLGNDEESIRLLVNLIVLVHQLKGTKLGIYVVLNLLRKGSEILVMQVVGDPTISPSKDISNITEKDYVLYSGFMADSNSFNVEFKIKTTDFKENQCIMSVAEHGALVEINTLGAIVLSLGSNRKSWNITDSLLSSKKLLPNTEYNVKFMYDGYEYQVQLAQGDGKYETYVAKESTENLGITRGILYLGVDNSTGTVKDPFKGYINYSNFLVEVDNIFITTWFEQTPIAPENTFIIKTELDVDLVSASFFENFSNFIRKYVYPTLLSFEASFNFNNKVTFLPYIRSKVTYVAQGDLDKKTE